MSENEEKFINSIQFDSIQRKDFCRLLLKLMQNVDLEFEEIADKILNREEIIEIVMPNFLKISQKWTKNRKIALAFDKEYQKLSKIG